MNRCLSSFRFCSLLLVACLGLFGLAAESQAQTPQRVLPISAKALRGVLRVVSPPDVLLDGKAARLSPGARIRSTNNLIVMPATLVGQGDLQVSYTLEPLGLIQEVWILTAQEIAASKR